MFLFIAENSSRPTLSALEPVETVRYAYYVVKEREDANEQIAIKIKVRSS